jgi:hypothetical protein
MAGKNWIQKVVKSIKKRGTEGSFREYCGGKVTMECIERGLKSKDPKVRKRAALAKAFMKSKKAEGGEINNELLDLIDTFSPRTAQAVLTDLDRYNQRMNQMAMLKAALGIEVKEEGRNNNSIVNKYAFGGQMKKYQDGGEPNNNQYALNKDKFRNDLKYEKYKREQINKLLPEYNALKEKITSLMAEHDNILSKIYDIDNPSTLIQPKGRLIDGMTIDEAQQRLMDLRNEINQTKQLLNSEKYRHVREYENEIQKGINKEYRPLSDIMKPERNAKIPYYYQEGGDINQNQPQQVTANEPQNEFGYDISYTQFVQFVSQYPEYFKQLIAELQAQQQMNSPSPEQPMQ